MTNDNPLEFFCTNDSQEHVKPKPKPEVILYDRHGEAHPNHFQQYAWKTTLTDTGAVDITMQVVAKAWYIHSFCERYDPDGCDRTGTWVMFTEDVTFRAGEGLWLVPYQVMKAPRVEVRRPRD